MGFGKPPRALDREFPEGLIQISSCEQLLICLHSHKQMFQKIMISKPNSFMSVHSPVNFHAVWVASF